MSEKKILFNNIVNFEPILIPVKNVVEIIRNLEDTTGDVEIIFEENQISFIYKKQFLTSRIINGAFPDYKQIIPKEFNTEIISLKEDVWHQASGSFWAARAYAKLNQYEDINFWLKRAADNPESFYGFLASQILGIKNPINWTPNKLGADEKVILSLPAGKRIQALIQIGLLNELENEIIKINSFMNKDIAMWSLDIAQHFNLAYTQIKIAGKLKRYDVFLPTKYYYPTPIWQPLNGFTLDPSLLYADRKSVV